MSVQAISAALAIRGTVTPSERLLLIVLANYADAKMLCWPAQARLAAETGLTDRTIRTLLASLEEKRLLKRKARTSNGRRTSDLIMLTMSPETISALDAQISGEPGNPRPFSPETISEEPTSEPFIEPLARAPARGVRRSLRGGKKISPLRKAVP